MDPMQQQPPSPPPSPEAGPQGGDPGDEVVKAVQTLMALAQKMPSLQPHVEAIIQELGGQGGEAPPDEMPGEEHDTYPGVNKGKQSAPMPGNAAKGSAPVM